ncbi:MAG: glutathione peroxidase [Magnetospiraceae bacterium]
MRILSVLLLLAVILASPARAETAHDFAFTAIEGGALALGDYKGKTLLVVNTATQCGNTHQFGTLQKLWDTYKDQGLVVISVPSNDFGQEPRDEAGIKQFCSLEFSADFPMTTREHVKGSDAHPFFQWVEKNQGNKAVPSWNFFKYLVDKDGNLVNYYGTGEDPMGDKIRTAVESALKS